MADESGQSHCAGSSLGLRRSDRVAAWAGGQPFAPVGMTYIKGLRPRGSRQVQVLEFIILGVLAGVVLFQLYAVLGRKVGRGPNEATAQPNLPAAVRDAMRVAAPTTETAPALSGV